MIGEALISRYLSQPILFSLSKHNVQKKNLPRWRPRSSQGWNVSERHADELRKTAGSSRRADARFNLSNTLSYIRTWCCCCCCRTFQPPPQLSGGKPRPFDFWPPEILLTPLKEKQVERCSSTADGSNFSFLNKFVHICRLMTSCLLVKSVICKIKPKIEDRS